MNGKASKSSKQESELEEAAGQYHLGQLSEAEKICRRVLRARPSYSRGNLLLGMILKDQNEDDEAIKVLNRAITVEPDLIAAHTTLSSVLHKTGKYVEAEASARKALGLDPNSDEAQMLLAGSLFDQGRFQDSVAWFRSYASKTYGHPGGNSIWPSSAHRLKHDREQREYMNQRMPGATEGFFFNIDEGSRVSGHAVNPDTSGGRIEAEWKNSSPQIVVLDNLLTDEALRKMNEFCASSTIWHRSYDSGYLGTVPELGFACPLLAQVTDELRAAYPAILGEHKLTRCWAIKCDNALNGTSLHADFAAVNVNFWITPDHANLDPESGGLVVWGMPASLDLTFEEINNPGAAIERILKERGAKSVTIPYRSNRAVIFDSDLYHKTDRINFKPGYLNRRINITMLYGHRHGGAPHDHDHDH